MTQTIKVGLVAAPGVSKNIATHIQDDLSNELAQHISQDVESGRSKSLQTLSLVQPRT